MHSLGSLEQVLVTKCPDKCHVRDLGWSSPGPATRLSDTLTRGHADTHVGLQPFRDCQGFQEPWSGTKATSRNS